MEEAAEEGDDFEAELTVAAAEVAVSDVEADVPEAVAEDLEPEIGPEALAQRKQRDHPPKRVYTETRMRPRVDLLMDERKEAAEKY